MGVRTIPLYQPKGRGKIYRDLFIYKEKEYIGSYIIKLEINMNWNERNENNTKYNVIFVLFLYIHLYLG